jgi:NhaP-type Na+/H+ or K+/H+ antiporter
LVYALILLVPFKNKSIERKSIIEKIIIAILLGTYLFGLMLNNFDKEFLYKNDFLYTYSGLILMLICIILFSRIWVKKYYQLKNIKL